MQKEIKSKLQIKIAHIRVGRYCTVVVDPDAPVKPTDNYIFHRGMRDWELFGPMYWAREARNANENMNEFLLRNSHCTANFSLKVIAVIWSIKR